MLRHFTLEYWIDESSQGESLEELEENIRDAYRLMIDEERVLALPQTTIMAKNWELRRETA
jgi:hypothetical protein